MPDMFTFFLWLTFIGASTTFILTPFTISLARRFRLIDNSAKRPHPAHTHSGIVPRAGGLPVLLGIFIPLIFLTELNKQLGGIMISAAILVLSGLWDDRKSRSPYIRFFINCLAVGITIAAGIGIPFITNPGGSGVIMLNTWQITISFWGTHTIIVWADLLAFIWILWTTNIIGWSGGVDGQLPGFVGIAAFVIGILSLRYTLSDPSQLYVSTLAFLTAGAFLGFLPWNFYPQKIMPGYGGKTLAGFMLAVLSIMAFSKLGTALLILAIPMIDAIFMLVKRTLSGQSPMWATSGHLHHQLLAMGWGKRRIALFYWIITALLGLVALSLNPHQKVFAGILLVIPITGFIIVLSLFKKSPPS